MRKEAVYVRMRGELVGGERYGEDVDEFADDTG